VRKPIAAGLALAAALSVRCGGGKDESAGGESPKAASAPAAAPAAASADAPYQTVAAVADAGSVTGTITLSGPVPALKPREVTTDRDKCGGDHVANPSLVLGPGNTVADAVVTLVGVKAGKGFSAGTPELDQKKCLFEPYVQVVPAGSELTLINSDPVLHNVHAYDAANTSLFNVSMALQGVKLKQKVPVGLIRVKCDVHPWMTGFVYASDTPYAAVTKKDGTFSIDGVPPGAYTLHVWHEVLGTKDAGVTVPPKGAASVNVALSILG
jgi:plastocyanin